MSPPASTDSLLLYIDGNLLFNAKPAIRFLLAVITAPRRARRVHPGAAYSARQISGRNRPQLVSPKAEWSTPAHAPRLRDPLSPRVQWPEWPDRREPRHE